jgi:BACON domain-containing protein
VILTADQSSTENTSWTASSDVGASFTPSSGTLTSGGQQQVTITSMACQNGTFTFTASGAAQPQIIKVSWNCTPYFLTISPSGLDFGAVNPNTTMTLPETIINTGGQTLNWNVDTKSLPSWLSVDTISGTVQPGSQQTINVTVNTVGLAPGQQYAATITIDSDGGGYVKVTVNMVVPIS